MKVLRFMAGFLLMTVVVFIIFALLNASPNVLAWTPDMRVSHAFFTVLGGFIFGAVCVEEG